jgi:hypothetical protein
MVNVSVKVPVHVSLPSDTVNVGRCCSSGGRGATDGVGGAIERQPCGQRRAASYRNRISGAASGCIVPGQGHRREGGSVRTGNRVTRYGGAGGRKEHAGCAHTFTPEAWLAFPWLWWLQLPEGDRYFHRTWQPKCLCPTSTATLTVGVNPMIQTVTSGSSYTEVTPPALQTIAPYDILSIFGGNFCVSGGTGCTGSTPVLYGTLDPVTLRFSDLAQILPGAPSATLQLPSRRIPKVQRSLLMLRFCSPVTARST